MKLLLTARELEVLELLANGLRYAEIGGRLFVSEETVRRHLRKARGKLCARTSAEAVAVAIRDGLLEGPGVTSAFERRLEELAVGLSDLAMDLASVRDGRAVAA